MLFHRHKRRSQSNRKGLGTTEFVLILGGVAVAIVWAVSSVGSTLTNDLNKTATNVADPSTLANRFGGGDGSASSASGSGSGSAAASASSSSGSGSSGSSSSSSKSKGKGK